MTHNRVVICLSENKAIRLTQRRASYIGIATQLCLRTSKYDRLQGIQELMYETARKLVEVLMELNQSQSEVVQCFQMFCRGHLKLPVGTACKGITFSQYAVMLRG